MSRIPNDTISSSMDVRLTDEQELLRRSVREFAEAELRPHVTEWDEAQQFPPALLPKFAELGLMGIQFPEELRRRRRCRPSTTASASRSWPASIRRSACRSPRTTGSAPRTSPCSAPRSRSSSTSSRSRRGEQLAAWGLTEASSGQRRGVDADDGRPRRRQLGHQRHQAVHHPRPHRRPHRRDGGDQPRARAAAASPPSSSSAARPGSAPARRKTSSGCARARRAK